MEEWRMGPGLTINGKAVPAQHIRELTVPAEQARQAIRNNGFDEVIVRDEVNQKDYIVASTKLAIGPLRSSKPIDLTINGHKASLIDYDNELTSTAEGAFTGARNGWKDLADTTIGAVRTAVGTLGAGGSIAMVGGAVGGAAYYFVRTGSVNGAKIGARGFMSATSKGLLQGGLTTMKVIGIAAVAGAGIVTVAGAIRGATEANNTSRAQNFASISRISIAQGSTQRPTPADPTIVAPVTAPADTNTVIKPEGLRRIR
jgi:hypothetical protein